MPNLKSAKKRMLTAAKAHDRNAPVKTRVRTCRRKFMEAAATENVEVASEAFKAYCSALDKAAKKDVIKKNTAVRRKTRAANMVRGLTAAK